MMRMPGEQGDNQQLTGAHPPLRAADVFGALALAADLALGLPPEHVLRSCYISLCLAEQLALPPSQRVEVYYTALLMDAGCTAWTSQLAAFLLGDEIAARRQFVYFVDPASPADVLGWLRQYLAAGAPAPRRARQTLHFALHGRTFVREGFRNSCAVARRFAERMGLPEGVQQALSAIFEQWDGSGPHGARGLSIPLVARIVYAASFFEVFHRQGGPDAAARLARRKRGSAFDPTVVDAFHALAPTRSFWSGLEQESVWSTVQALEPASPYQDMPAGRLEQVALAFADFADLKLPDTLGHSRRVADLAERLARRLALPRHEVTTIRLAGLLHDVGLVAVPSQVLARPQHQLGQADWERLRLHPYHAERILMRVPAFAAAARLVATHHERFDGQGYPHGIPAASLPIGARILAVADRYDELCHGGPSRTPEAALAEITADAGQGLCPDACRALAHELGNPSAPPIPPTRVLPAGLTEREGAVLRLLARGASRREIADALVLSEHTVRHHLEHIYAKLGVSTRVAAALFAVEHGLLD